MDRREEEAIGAWVELASFPSTMDLVFVEAEFRERGIPYRLRDGLSLQVAPHLAQAMGGIRLEVPMDQVADATDLLLDLGVRERATSDENALLLTFDRATERLPFIGHRGLGFRVGLMAVVVLGLGTWAAIRLGRAWEPTPWELLTATTWCVRSATLDGEALPLGQSSGLAFVGCEGQLRFQDDQEVRLMGLGLPFMQGRWAPEGEAVRLRDLPAGMGHLEGLYAFRVTARTLELRSQRIHLRAQIDGAL